MSKNIVFEGWLTKSPPLRRIWKTKWRRRWFALRQSGELPGQYFLDYYADRNCRRHKGTINLDLCEQVVAGLHVERNGTGVLDPKLRGSVFTIQTQSRAYHLEADCVADMDKWVDAICRVCGLKVADEPSVTASYHNHLRNSNNEFDVCMDRGTSPYIPISECITGIRQQQPPKSYAYDRDYILMKSGSSDNTVNRRNRIYMSQAYISLHTELSENESNMSEEECKSLNTSQSNIRDWPVTKRFTKLKIGDKSHGVRSGVPPEPPPRPPKTFEMSKDLYENEIIKEPLVLPDPLLMRCMPQFEASDRATKGATPCSSRRSTIPSLRITDSDEDARRNASAQYCNMPPLPPAVDRALKPRHSSIGHITGSTQSDIHSITHDVKEDTLQYLDLDLHTSTPPVKMLKKSPKRVTIIDSKPLPSCAESAYKTVDFLKTEAFNITRKDAEASRSNQQ